MQKKPNFALLDPISRELLKISEFSFFPQMRAQKIFKKFQTQNPLRSKLDFSETKNDFFFGPWPLWAPVARPMTLSRTSSLCALRGSIVQLLSLKGHQNRTEQSKPHEDPLIFPRAGVVASQPDVFKNLKTNSLRSSVFKF